MTVVKWSFDCIVQLFIGTFSFVVTHTYVLNNRIVDVHTEPAGRLLIALLLSTGKEASLVAEELCSRIAGSLWFPSYA